MSGAEVGLTWQAVLEDDPNRRTAGRPIEQSVLSNVEGRFEISDAPEGEERLTVTAQGFIPAEERKVTVPQPDSAPKLKFVLRRGARLEGRVATVAGQSVPGVRISVETGSARSDAEGLYVLDGLALGRQEVHVFHPDYKRMVRPVSIKEGTNRFDVELEAGVQVSGRVIDQEKKLVAVWSGSVVTPGTGEASVSLP